MIQVTKSQYFFLFMIITHGMQSAPIAVRKSEFVQVQAPKKSQKSSLINKLCFGCASDATIQQAPVSVNKNKPVPSQPVMRGNKVKPSYDVSDDLELTNSSTTSDNSDDIVFVPQKKPIAKPTFLGSFSKMFSAKPENVNRTDSWGFTPLHTAVSKGDVTEMMRLIDAGADVNAMTFDHDTVLNFAMKHSGRDRDGSEYSYIGQYLLEHGAQVDGRDKAGKSPLHWAAENLSTDSVQLLLRYRADVNAQDALGYTPLMIVARKDLAQIIGKPTQLHKLQADVVKLLLDAGADTTIMTFQDKQSVYSSANYQITFKNNMLPAIGDALHKAQYPTSKQALSSKSLTIQ